MFKIKIFAALLEERVLTRDNLLTILPIIGRTFEISFDILISKYETRGVFQSIINFSADQANKEPQKYGDRHPGVWIHSTQKNLYICSTLNGNANYCFRHTPVLPVEKWIHIEISQTLQTGIQTGKVNN